MEKSIYQKIEVIIKKDKRYHFDAYDFVWQALHFTQDKLKRKGHITGKELSEGAKDFACEQFGPMARVVLEHWGINKTDDIGEIVFNLIEHKLLRKTEEDSKEDFKNLFDFKEAFDKNYKEVISQQLYGGKL